MALNLPTSIASIYTKLANSVKDLISKSNPFKTNSLTKAILTAFAGRIWDVYKKIEAFIDQMFDDTRSGIYLDREAADYGITRKAATVATGYISVTGTAGETVPQDTEYSIDSLVYTVDSDTIITSNVESVTADYDSGVVTVTFTSDHNLGTGQEVAFSAFSNPELNITATVRVISATELEYDADIAGTGSDSGTATYANAAVPITSDGFGEDYNKNSGEILTIGATIENIDNDAVVTYDGLTGGTDQEDDETLRGRLQQRKKFPAAFFNESQVKSIFLEISWVNRVFVQRVTPSAGEATIYLVKADNGIPSAGEITEAKTYFEPYLPVNCDYTLIHVEAPSELATSFTFTALSPDTSTMRAAIEANLAALFLEQSEVGEAITEARYKGIIAGTIDPQTLDRVSTFTLSSPSGDISPASDELPTYDGTTWSI